MKAKTLRLKLRELLKQELETIGIEQMAKTADVVPNTLKHLLYDDAGSINRRALEHLLDHYDSLSVESIFELVDEPFWQAFLDAGNFTIGLHSAKGNALKLDLQATDMIERCVQNYAESCTPERKPLPRLTKSLLESENIVVIGSPVSNALANDILSEFFTAEATKYNGSRPQLQFSFPPGHPTHKGRHGPFVVTAAQESDRGIRCVYEGATYLARCPWVANEDFQPKAISNGVDAGFVFVVNRNGKNGRSVKTILLAGMTGIGTRGVAERLVKDFRDLEPRPGAPYTLGLPEVKYKKPADDLSWELDGFDWIFLEGGRRKVRSVMRPMHRTATP